VSAGACHGCGTHRTSGPGPADSRPGRTATLWLMVLALLAPGCDPPAEPPSIAPDHPAGTVLTVDGVPVTQAEVDRWAAVTAMIEPDKVQAHWRRLALANIVLPLRTAESLDPEGRRAAFEQAERLRGLAVELDRIPEVAEVHDIGTGTWKQVGLIDWEVARGLAVGEWSDVYETPGGWAYLRLLERPDGPPGEALGPHAELRFERVHVFYLAPEGLRTLVDDALRKLPIEVVDPEWEALVPPIFLQHAVQRTP
jgi:hypothetical protein